MDTDSARVFFFDVRQNRVLTGRINESINAFMSSNRNHPKPDKVSLSLSRLPYLAHIPIMGSEEWYRLLDILPQRLGRSLTRDDHKLLVKLSHKRHSDALSRGKLSQQRLAYRAPKRHYKRYKTDASGVTVPARGRQ